MRKFYLINELNIRYDLQSFDSDGFLSTPSGLGYETNFTYVRIGSSFLADSSELIQGSFTGNIYFKGYSEYEKFIEYVEKSKSLRLIYKPLDIEYFRDVDFSSITKTEIDAYTGCLICPIKLNYKGLYYTEDNTRFVVESVEGESRYTIAFPFNFNDYSIVGVNYTNDGHDEGTLLTEIYGYVENPTLELYIDDRLIYKVTFDIIVNEGQKLLYSAKDGDNYILLEDVNGQQTPVIGCLNLDSDNFFKIPKGTCFIKLSSKNGAILGRVLFTIITPYKGV